MNTVLSSVFMRSRKQNRRTAPRYVSRKLRVRCPNFGIGLLIRNFLSGVMGKSLIARKKKGSFEMKINVTIKRSDEWVKQQRIETGENVQHEIQCEIDTAELTPENRKRILEYLRSYQDVKKLFYDSTFSPNQSAWGYGSYSFCCDSVKPSPEDINKAIETAFNHLDERRKERLKQEEQREKERLEKLSKEEAEKQKREEAKLILAKEIAQLAEYKERVDILSEFIAEIPLDSLRGTLKKIVSSETEIENLKKKIENASSQWVFDNRNEEDE